MDLCKKNAKRVSILISFIISPFLKTEIINILKVCLVGGKIGRVENKWEKIREKGFWDYLVEGWKVERILEGPVFSPKA